MKVVKIIVLIVLALFAVLFAIGTMAPKDFSVKRDIVIQSSPEKIFPIIGDFNNWSKWSPWYAMEPDAVLQVSGDPLTIGHRQEWKGKKIGAGKIAIIEIVPSSSIHQSLEFSEPMESKALTIWTVTPEAEDSSRLSWEMKGEATGALHRLMNLMTDKMVGKDFETGLQSIKALAESP